MIVGSGFGKKFTSTYMIVLQCASWLSECNVALGAWCGNDNNTTIVGLCAVPQSFRGGSRNRERGVLCSPDQLRHQGVGLHFY